MKKRLLFVIMAALVLLAAYGCKGLLVTEVRFQNNSTSKTVDAIWDGSAAATLAPGQTSKYSQQNPGTHTIMWQDHSSGRALTTTAWPNLVEGHSYTFPYND